MKILYMTDAGVAVITPAPEVLLSRTIKEVADKDVPAGRPYAIVEDAAVPSDRTFRAAWTVDAAGLVDGVGADSNEFAPLPEPERPTIEPVVEPVAEPVVDPVTEPVAEEAEVTQ